MKIALIRPPGAYDYWFKRPVLGIGYICACLERNGFDCKIFDAEFHSWTEKELLRRVEEYEPDAVGITAMTLKIVPASRLAGQLKKQLRVPIIIGGCHVTALPERTLAEFSGFDYGVYGEGEKTILELLDCLKQDTEPDVSNINGLAYRKGERIFVNEPRPFLTSEELDCLPYPAFHHYYGKNPDALKGRHSYYVIITSRGCPYRCAFCMQILGHKVRRRSPENVCDELEYAISTYGAHTIDFADEIFLFDGPETRGLLQLMINKGLPKRIRWSGLVRANFANRELIAMAKEAGCFHLEMGVESGDNEILKTINKNITVEQVKGAVKIIKEAGISLTTYYILGHPNETRQTLRKTINLAAELNTNDIAVGLMVPYPGTKIFDMALRGEGRYRLLTQDWSEYDKYCATALELEGLPHKEIEKWQRRAYIKLYLRNLRFFDMFKLFWRLRKVFRFFFRKLWKTSCRP